MRRLRIGGHRDKWDSEYDPHLQQGQTMRPVRALIVDDDSDIRMMLSLNLLAGPVEVVGEAADGKDGLDLAVELEPDLIVMDLMMPVMDGAEATRLIKKELPSTAIVGFTASNSEGADRLLQAGATGVFAKDKLPELLRTLEQLFGGN
ncbi:MAG: response regulator [Actinomycetota bacterium]